MSYRASNFRIDAVEHSSSGTVKVRAKLTKTGVFEYDRGGERVRELRADSEVFSEAAIDSLDGCAVTIDHPSDFVDSDNWRELAVGHVSAVQPDPPYVTGKLHVHDARAQHLIEAGTLKEISCGYFCEPVRLDSDEADYAQTKIRFNHAALGPEGWGRLGRDVGLTTDSNELGTVLRLDSKGDQIVTPFGHETDCEWRQDIADAEKHLREVEALNAQEARKEAKWLKAYTPHTSGYEEAKHDAVVARAKRHHRVTDAQWELRRARMSPATRKALDELFEPVEIALGLRPDPDAPPRLDPYTFDPFKSPAADDALRRHILGDS